MQPFPASATRGTRRASPNGADAGPHPRNVSSESLLALDCDDTPSLVLGTQERGGSRSSWHHIEERFGQRDGRRHCRDNQPHRGPATLGGRPGPEDSETLGAFGHNVAGSGARSGRDRARNDPIDRKTMKDAERCKTPAYQGILRSSGANPGDAEEPCNGLLIRRLWVRVPPPEPPKPLFSGGVGPVEAGRRHRPGRAQDAIPWRSGHPDDPSPPRDHLRKGVCTCSR